MGVEVTEEQRENFRRIVGSPKKVRRVTTWTTLDNLAAALVAIKLAKLGDFSWWVPFGIFAFNFGMAYLGGRLVRYMQREAGFAVPK